MFKEKMKQLALTILTLLTLSCDFNKKNETQNTDTTANGIIQDTIRYVDTDIETYETDGAVEVIEDSLADNSSEFIFFKPYIKDFIKGNPKLFKDKDSTKIKQRFSWSHDKSPEGIVDLVYENNGKADTLKTLIMFPLDTDLQILNRKTLGRYYWPPKGISIPEGVKQLQKLKTETTAKLATATPEEANLLYKNFTIKSTEIIGDIELYESELLDTYYYFYDYDESAPESEQTWTLNLPKTEKEKTKLLNDNGIEIWDVGEGLHALRLYYDTEQKLFTDYLTPDYQEYLNLITAESKDLFQADAALTIEFSELANRIINWEKFIKKYPESELLQSSNNQDESVINVKKHYKFLQNVYVFGMENTPTLDYSNCELYPESIEEFKRFKDKYPESYTNKLIDLITQNTDTIYDNLKRKILAEQDKNPLLQ